MKISLILAMQDRDARRLDEAACRIEAPGPPIPEPPAREDLDERSGYTTFEL